MKFREVLIGDIGDMSRPARGAWIEIVLRGYCQAAGAVAPRKGRVD